MKRTEEKGKMVALVLSRVESCIEIQGRAERKKGSRKALRHLLGSGRQLLENP